MDIEYQIRQFRKELLILKLFSAEYGHGVIIVTPHENDETQLQAKVIVPPGMKMIVNVSKEMSEALNIRYHGENDIGSVIDVGFDECLVLARRDNWVCTWIETWIEEERMKQ
jgi:hypothetical protein